MAIERQLTPFDDYFIHQADEPIVLVQDGDPRWIDRGNFWVYDADMQFCLMMGMGSYANTRLMDGFTSAVVGDTQHNLRLSRHMNGDRTNTRVGPLRYHIVEPLWGWQLDLDTNSADLGFSLQYRGRSAPFLMEKIVIPTQGEERPTSTQSHFMQFGSYQGWVELAGQRFEGSFIGIRDRTWGVRINRWGRAIHLWLQAHFSNYCLSLLYHEASDRSTSYCDGVLLYDSGEIVKVVDVRHRIEFDQRIWEQKALDLMLKLEDGRSLYLRSKRALRGIFLAGEGYGGWHGIPHGENHQEGERWDLRVDAGFDVHALATHWYDQPARFEANGEAGVGIIECGYSRRLARDYQPTF